MNEIVLTEKDFEIAAIALAQVVNGGSWEFDYTEEQREEWRARLRRALEAAEARVRRCA